MDVGTGEGSEADASSAGASPTPTPTPVAGVVSRDGFVGGQAYGVSPVQSVRREVPDHQGWVDLTLLLMVTSFDTDPAFKPSAALSAITGASDGSNELCF